MQTILGKSVQCHVRIRSSVFISTSISECFRLRREFRTLVLEGAHWNSHLIMDGPLRCSLTCGTRSPCHALVALLPTCQSPKSSRPHRRSCLTNEWVRRTRIALTRVSDRRPRCAWALSPSGAGSNLGEAWQRDRAGHTY